MTRYLLRRLTTLVITLVVVSVVVFVMGRVSGDPRALLMSPNATLDQYEELGRKLGLDKPLYAQYWIFIQDAVRGDMGTSIRERRPVRAIILERLPNTLRLAAAAFVFSVVAGVPLGVLSATRRGSLLDSVGKVLAMSGQAIPTFWLGIMLIFLFSVKLEWLPPSGRAGATSIILPAITLGWFFAAVNMRLIRSAMLDVLDSEYIKLARAKGLASHMVIWKHAFRNAMIPSLTFGGITLGLLVSGSVVTETIFAWPGIGRLAIESLLNFDYPLLQGVVLFSSALYSLSALLIDALYAVVDPRIRYSGE